MSPLAVAPANTATSTVRQIVHRSRGQTHGPITRLMSPGDLGEVLKPFVFLDLFDNGGKPISGFGLHPHSGIATLTYIAEGSVGYRGYQRRQGRARGRRRRMDAGGRRRVARRRRWQARPYPRLPAVGRLAAKSRARAVDELYQSARDIPVVGPARVLLGSHAGAASAITAPSPINYLAVTLTAGERWTIPASARPQRALDRGRKRRGHRAAGGRAGRDRGLRFRPRGGGVRSADRCRVRPWLGRAARPRAGAGLLLRSHQHRSPATGRSSYSGYPPAPRSARPALGRSVP